MPEAFVTYWPLGERKEKAHQLVLGVDGQPLLLMTPGAATGTLESWLVSTFGSWVLHDMRDHPRAFVYPGFHRAAGLLALRGLLPTPLLSKSMPVQTWQDAITNASTLQAVAQAGCVVLTGTQTQVSSTLPTAETQARRLAAIPAPPDPSLLLHIE